MNNNGSSLSSVLIGILVLVVIVIVGWIAYSQGFFNAKQQQTNQTPNGIQVQLGGTSNPNTSNTNGY